MEHGIIIVLLFYVFLNYMYVLIAFFFDQLGYEHGFIQSPIGVLDSSNQQLVCLAWLVNPL